MKCLILAGGFATRLWPLSEKRVKPLLHVKDRPLLSHLLGMFPNDVKIWVAVNRAYSAGIETWARNEGHGRVQVVIEESSNDAEKKGALGAVAAFVQSHGMEEDLMVVAGDNYFGFAMKDFLAAFQGKPLLAAHDVKEVSAARRFGVVQSQAGRMTGFEEKPEHPKSTLVSTGCYLFPQKNLGDIVVYAAKHKDNLGGIFEHFLTQGQPVDVFEFSEPWYDIGSFESYLAANLELLDGQAVLEEGVVNEENRLEGGVFVGRGSAVRHSTLQGVVVLPHCVIEDCVLRHCVIDEGSHLKGIDLSHQMLRAGSRIKHFYSNKSI